jgi:hypothetical protein
MKKITFQRARVLQLLLENIKDDLSNHIEEYHHKLNNNTPIKTFIQTYLGENETIEYILANNFECLTMREVEQGDLCVYSPEVLVIFTSKRILIFKNVKNKSYYKSKSQVPGFERGYHLFDSCLMIRYDRVEHYYFEKNSLRINQYSSNVNEKNDRLKIDLNLYDFCFEKITKIIGNYM